MQNEKKMCFFLNIIEFESKINTFLGLFQKYRNLIYQRFRSIFY